MTCYTIQLLCYNRSSGSLVIFLLPAGGLFIKLFEYSCSLVIICKKIFFERDIPFLITKRIMTLYFYFLTSFSFLGFLFLILYAFSHFLNLSFLFFFLIIIPVLSHELYLLHNNFYGLKVLSKDNKVVTFKQDFLILQNNSSS